MPILVLLVSEDMLLLKMEQNVLSAFQPVRTVPQIMFWFAKGVMMVLLFYLETVWPVRLAVRLATLQLVHVRLV